MGVDYLQICCCISFGIAFFPIFEKLLQATGRSMYSTIAQIGGAVTNIILDPILIYGLLGAPKMGVKGAAYASVFGLWGETEQLCIGAMRIVSLSFVFAGANIALQGIFQALDSGLESLVISVCRQILFVLPVAWGFSLFARNNAQLVWTIWMTFPIAELVSMLIALVFMRNITKNKIEGLEG